MEPDEVRTLVRTMEERSGQGYEMLPGTLQDLSDTQGTVLLDGTTEPIGVNVVTECVVGDRVMVLFVPPRGGFVVGRMGTYDLATKTYVDAKYDDLIENGQPWNTAWGLVGIATKTTNSTISTTTIDVPGLSVGFTAVTGRKYKMQVHGRLNSITGSYLAMIVRITDSADTTIGGWVFNTNSASFNVGCAAVAFATPSAGATTYKIRASGTIVNGFQFNCSDTFPTVFSIEDVGPA